MSLRREFITLLGGAATAWPITAWAQQQVAMPVIGLLNSATLEAQAERLAAFQQGLNETGFVGGRNVTIDYRSAEGLTDQLPILARDLVRRQVSVMVAYRQAATAVSKRTPRGARFLLAILVLSGLHTLLSVLLQPSRCA